MRLNIRRPVILWEGEGGGGGGPTQGDPPAQGGGQQQGDPQPGPVPYERFKQVNDELKTLKDQFAQFQQAEKSRKDKEAAEQGQWQKLAEEREAALKTERQARLRLEVAAKKGVPVDLIDRLRGETAEEMAKDADTLLKFMKPNEGPGVPPAGKGKPTPTLDLEKMSPAQIREKADEIWEQKVNS